MTVSAETATPPADAPAAAAPGNEPVELQRPAEEQGIDMDEVEIKAVFESLLPDRVVH